MTASFEVFVLIHSNDSVQSLVAIGKAVPPLSIVGGVLTTFIQLPFAGYVSGTRNKIIITITNEILGILSENVNLPIELFLKISFDRIDNPTEDKIISDIEAKTSSLTKAELTYTPVIPKIKTNTFISVLRYSVLVLLRINQIAIPPKIISTE